MHTTVAKALSIATLALFATGAFAADVLNANNNKATQSNSGARAEQKIKIGVMKNPGFLSSARVNANNNQVTQTNSGARAKQDVEIGVYK